VNRQQWAYSDGSPDCCYTQPPKRIEAPRPSLPVQGEERGYGKRDSAVIGDSKQSVEKERTETGEVRTCCT